MLSFKILGQAILRNEGQLLNQFRSQKEAALLFYLAHTGQTQQREFIADLLWNSSSTKQSLSNLRTALTRLRKQVGDELVVTRKTLALTPESLQQTDSVSLLQTLRDIRQIDSAEKASALHAALDTYCGDFLAGFELAHAPNFESWVITTREQIRRQVIAAYKKLVHYALHTGDVETGIAVAHSWLQVDELDEAAHTLLIRLLLEDNQTRAALTHYDECVELLRTELDIDPPSEMTALVQDARSAPTPQRAQNKLEASPFPSPIPSTPSPSFTITPTRCKRARRKNP